MGQLTCNDLKPGDLMLKIGDGTIISKGITSLQKGTGHANSMLVHAGIMFDKHYMIETVGAGVIANDLRVYNKNYAYRVYRANSPEIAKGAGTCAKMLFDIEGRQGNINYALWGAIGSLFGKKGKAQGRKELDGLLNRILKGKNTSFFCSQFVVFVFQYVAEQNGKAANSILPGHAAKMNPSNLGAQLVNSSQFSEAGWMFAGER
jgi:hypothetical protein